MAFERDTAADPLPGGEQAANFKRIAKGTKVKVDRVKVVPTGRTSNHQNGIAFDIAVGGGAGNPIYDWLTKNAPARGFIRTVNREPWHWEFDPARAAAVVKKHTFKTSNVTV